ncbi:hypothetical protein V500_07453 [Pseudogymnoascus sp. VKM F-4518 (FW-2643)]|nr:hypothetical protein V500_07453 [Pseudogymnoascus sp. VKM F-4518 (FW-2643)]
MAENASEANEKGVSPIDATMTSNSGTDAAALSDGDDVALAIVGLHAQPIDPLVEARVVRKIDSFLIPAMIVGYGMVYYDKVAASLFSSCRSD